MPFVQAKCPMCGGMLAVDNSKKAAVCQFCGEAFVVEEAVNNYITNNITNNTVNNTIGDGAVVNVYEQSKSIPALLKRVTQFLEDKDWASANAYCEDILDIDPQNAQAYLGKLMAEFHASHKTDLARYKSLEGSVNYRRALQCGDVDFQDELRAIVSRENFLKCKQERIRKYQESGIEYQNTLKLWEGQVAAIKRTCKEKADDALSVEKEALLSNIESKYFKAKDQLSQQLQLLEQDKSQAELSAMKLGLFAFSEKKAAKEHISELTAQIRNVEHKLAAAKHDFDAEKANLANWESDRRDQLLTGIKNEHPLPPEPNRTPILLDDGTTITAALLRIECIMDIIIDNMEPGVPYDKNQLLNMVSGFDNITIYQVMGVANSMIERGYLQRVMEAGVAYYVLR